MTSPTPTPPRPSAGRMSVPVVGAVLVAWVVLWLLMMWHADWPWIGRGFLDVGSPGTATLKLFGAVVPAAFRWQSIFLAPLLHASLLGLLFLIFFWRSTGRTVLGLVGPSWTWVAFVLGGAASTAGHLRAHPHGALPFAVGPFDPILCGIGLLFGWGLVHREARLHATRAVRTLLFLCVWMVLMALLSGVALGDLGSPQLREAFGAEGMLAALVAGLALALVLAALRRASPTLAAWTGRGLAVGLLLAVLTAIVTQAEPIVRSADRSAAGDFLAQLRRVERDVDGLLDQSRATDEARNALARAHARLVADPFLEELEGREAFDAYAEVLGLYRYPVEAPFITEPQLRLRYRAWYDEVERDLRERFALPARPFHPWENG